MTSEIINTTFDFLIAFLVAGLLVWFGITQPVFSFFGQSSVPEIDSAILQKHVEELSQTYAPRTPDFEGIRPAAHYIYRQLTKAGQTSGRKPKYQPFWTMGGGRYSNIIFSLGPATAETVVIGAHYDTRNSFPGADNNASGVATLIELARALSIVEKELPIRVELVAYALSEGSVLGTKDMGSFKHAKMLKKKNRDVKLMISVDSVGYFTSESNSQKYPFSFMKLVYPTRGNFINITSHLQDFMHLRQIKKSFKKASNLAVHSVTAPEIFPNIANSDHINYWKHGYPALHISDTTSYRYKHYNTLNDTANKLNYGAMAMVVQGLYQTVMDFPKSKGKYIAEPEQREVWIINPKDNK
ncbi:MAG: M28 family peptidase [Cocleimonas sp.]|nr:M28 family peptidase [Cocleimonas sp.]